MPRRKRKSKRRGELTNAQWWELLLGPSSHVEVGSLWSSAFPTEADREHSYFLNVDAVSNFGAAGSRSWGWWTYESGVGHPPALPEVWLAEHGLLSHEEEAEILMFDACGASESSNEWAHPIAEAIRARSSRKSPRA